MSKSVKRSGSSQEKPVLAKSKATPSTAKLSAPSQSAKYKPLSFMLSASTFERKPVFRITSLSQNLVATAKAPEKEEEKEPVRTFCSSRENKQGVL